LPTKLLLERINFQSNIVYTNQEWIWSTTKRYSVLPWRWWSGMYLNIT